MKDNAISRLSPVAKMGLGSALATVGALGMVLSLLLGWPEVAGPWDLLLGFVVGLVTGLGAALGVAGMIERRRIR